MKPTFYDYIKNLVKTEKINILDDKITVRDHVASITILPKLYYHGSIKDCNFNDLPNSYVIKPTDQCNSRGVEFIQNNQNTNKNQIVQKYLKQNIHKVMIEEMLYENKQRVLTDYKFFIFNGEIKIISVIKNISTPQHKIYDFDIDWNRVRVHVIHGVEKRHSLQKPDNLEEMKAIAIRLGKFYHEFTSIPFVRVDLFDTDNGIIFGEYTQTPNAGENLTQEYQIKFGNYWTKSLHDIQSATPPNKKD